MFISERYIIDETARWKKTGVAKSEEDDEEDDLPDYLSHTNITDKQKEDLRANRQKEFDGKLVSSILGGTVVPYNILRGIIRALPIKSKKVGIFTKIAQSGKVVWSTTWSILYTKLAVFLYKLNINKCSNLSKREKNICYMNSAESNIKFYQKQKTNCTRFADPTPCVNQMNGGISRWEDIYNKEKARFNK